MSIIVRGKKIRAAVLSAACCVFLTVLLMTVSRCGQSEYVPPAGTSYIHLTAEEAAAMIEAGDCVLVDVRGEPQYDLKHIRGAICIPYDEPDEVFLEKLPDKTQQILLYCDYGGISKETAEHLTGELGYENVAEFDGLLVWEGDTETNLE